MIFQKLQNSFAQYETFIFYLNNDILSWRGTKSIIYANKIRCTDFDFNNQGHIWVDRTVPVGPTGFGP